MSYTLKICSFNLGSVNDYYNSCKYFNRENSLNLKLDFKSKEEDAQFIKKYQEVEKANAEYLSTNSGCHVYCLQEVTHADRELIKQLKEKNFEMVHFENEDKVFDTAIAIDKTRFKDITNLSVAIKGNGDVAIATAIDRVTGKKVAFASGHVPGFNFLNEIEVEEEERPGNEYCEVLVQKLEGIKDCSLQMVGIDMNSKPLIKWDKECVDANNVKGKSGQKRFTYFNNFYTLRTRENTNVNDKDSIYKEREIDFFFFNRQKSVSSYVSAVFSFLSSIFVETFSSYERDSIFTARDDKLWGNLNLNCSDHVPIYHEVKPRMKPSKISIIGKFVINIFQKIIGKNNAV